MHDTFPRMGDIKVTRRNERANTSFRVCLPEGSRRTSKRTKKKEEEHLVMRVISVFFISIIAMCVAEEPTVQTRVTRTLPFDFSPSRWTGMFRTLLSGGKLWEWPRNGIDGLLRLVATPDTRQKMTFVFRPEDGPRASQDYQRRYGYRGQWLIDLLGSGFHPDAFQLPPPAAILVPPPPPL